VATTGESGHTADKATFVPLGRKKKGQVLFQSFREVFGTIARFQKFPRLGASELRDEFRRLHEFAFSLTVERSQNAQALNPQRD
jgi:hypothetical protein